MTSVEPLKEQRVPHTDVHPSEEGSQVAPTTKPKQIPDTYRRVTPCLVVQGGVKALELYAAVFGATERMRFPGPGGTVAHARSRSGTRS